MYATVLENAALVNETDLSNGSIPFFDASYSNDELNITTAVNESGMQSSFDSSSAVQKIRKAASVAGEGVVQQPAMDPQLDGKIIECAVCTKRRSTVVSV